MLPIEVLSHILTLGNFSFAFLASLRRVNRALCDAASDPLLYREIRVSLTVPANEAGSDRGATCLGAAADRYPPFVRTGVRHLRVKVMNESDALVDLALVVCRFPAATVVNAVAWRGDVSIAGLPSSLTEFSINFAATDDLFNLSSLTSLRCLRISNMSKVTAGPPPLHTLSNLCRLHLRQYGGSPAEMLEAIGSAPCAANLEALLFHHNVFRRDPPRPGWWAPIGSLVALTELSLAIGYLPSSYRDDWEAFAELVSGMAKLSVFDLRCRTLSCFTALLSAGLPPNLQALSLESSNVVDPALVVAALPAGLRALSFEAPQTQLSTDDLAAALRLCPCLSVLVLEFGPVVLSALLAPDLSAEALGRSLLVQARDAHMELRRPLASAGHTLMTSRLMVEVGWRHPGGVFLDFEPLDLGD